MRRERSVLQANQPALLFTPGPPLVAPEPVQADLDVHDWPIKLHLVF